MYSSGFINPIKDEQAYESLQTADRNLTIPDFSIIENEKFKKYIAKEK